MPLVVLQLEKVKGMSPVERCLLLLATEYHYLLCSVGVGAKGTISLGNEAYKSQCAQRSLLRGARQHQDRSPFSLLCPLARLTCGTGLETTKVFLLRKKATVVSLVVVYVLLGG